MQRGNGTARSAQRKNLSRNPVGGASSQPDGSGKVFLLTMAANG
jgi:hypothetical protein